jgi:hypothetical protein
VAIVYLDGLLGYVDDYNITARTPCTGVLGVNKGVCPDLESHVGGTNDNQIQTFSQENGITQVSSPHHAKFLEASTSMQVPYCEFLEASSSKRVPQSEFLEASSSKRVPRSEFLEASSSKRVP